MATRRNVPTPLDKSFPKPPLGEKSNITPAVPAHVIYKLLGFTFAMIIAPIGSYFVTLDTIYRGNSTYAGATAAIVANVVLLGYIIVAFNEDDGDGEESKKGI